MNYAKSPKAAPTTATERAESSHAIRTPPKEYWTFALPLVELPTRPRVYTCVICGFKWERIVEFECPSCQHKFTLLPPTRDT